MDNILWLAFVNHLGLSRRAGRSDYLCYLTWKKLWGACVVKISSDGRAREVNQLSLFEYLLTLGRFLLTSDKSLNECWFFYFDAAVTSLSSDGDAKLLQ